MKFNEFNNIEVPEEVDVVEFWLMTIHGHLWIV